MATSEPSRLIATPSTFENALAMKSDTSDAGDTPRSMNGKVGSRHRAALYVIARLPLTGPPSPNMARLKSPDPRTNVVSRNPSLVMSTTVDDTALVTGSVYL